MNSIPQLADWHLLSDKVQQPVSNDAELAALTQYAPIIISDDEPTMARLYEMILKRKGFRSVTVPDAREALAFCRRQPVSLVISDMMKPFMNGLEFLRELRTDPLSQAIPFLMVTATPRPEIEREFFELGGNGYVVKPMQLELLMQVIYRLLQLQMIPA